MKKYIVIALLLVLGTAYPAYARWSVGTAGGGAAAAAGATINSPTYFTANTTDFDSLTYATLNGNSQIVAGVDDDMVQSGDLAATQYWAGCTWRQVGQLSTGANNRWFLKFDLSEIPATATITSATLKFYIDSYNNATTINVYRVTQSWAPGNRGDTCESTDDADAINWNQYDGSNTWAAGGGDFSATLLGSVAANNPAYFSIANQTNCGGGSDDCLAQEYVKKVVDGTYTDYGLILKTSEAGTDDNKVRGSLDTDGTRPYLKVEWTN